MIQGFFLALPHIARYNDLSNLSCYTVKKFICLILSSLLISTSSLLSSCRTVPVTGRSQFILTSVEQEKALGLSAYKQYKSKFSKSTNPTYNAAMNSCASAIVKATEYTEYDWEYTVFNSETQNAFCLPGGKIAVYSGLIDLMNSEAELAFVVAHEVAHALARHGGEQSSWEQLQSLGTQLISTKSGSSESAAVFQKASELGVMLPFSRKHEYEADRIGMVLMAKAGYKPSAAIEFWSRFTEGANSSVIDGWMSTHPRDVDRIQAMRANLPEAEAAYSAATCKRGYGMSL